VGEPLCVRSTQGQDTVPASIGYIRAGNVRTRRAADEFLRFFALSVATSLKNLGADIPRRVFTRPGSTIGGDPVKNGLVASLNRPGGNVTGVTFLGNELGPKRLGLLRDLLPNAGLIAALVNPTNPNAESDAKDLLAAAQSIGMTLNVIHASNERDIDAFFATLVQRRASAFLTVSDP
jgi:ABC-type uncharacterized transport system substrate-binding protein